MTQLRSRNRAAAAASIRRTTTVVLLAGLCVGWSAETVRHVAWSAVEFFPGDLERHVRRHHKRFDAGIRRGLDAPPSWRAATPGNLVFALEEQVSTCATGLREPIPLADLVEELGVLAVRVLDASDPLAVAHDDPREPAYAEAYQAYVDSIRDRVRLVFYGQNEDLIYHRQVGLAVSEALQRGRSLYPYVGQEFYRTGQLRDWRTIDDRSVAFGVAAISLSRGLTDLANFASYVWYYGGGQVPTPRPTPVGHVGPTVTLTLEGGFPDRDRPARGAPAMPKGSLVLPPP
jgi:hypothetical protein